MSSVLWPCATHMHSQISNHLSDIQIIHLIFGQHTHTHTHTHTQIMYTHSHTHTHTHTLQQSYQSAFHVPTKICIMLSRSSRVESVRLQDEHCTFKTGAGAGAGGGGGGVRAATVSIASCKEWTSSSMFMEMELLCNSGSSPASNASASLRRTSGKGRLARHWIMELLLLPVL